MKQYGLLGEHLSHSYSKLIHQAIFEKLKIKAEYHLLECKEEEFPTYIQWLREKKYMGFNVTIPYKKKIMMYLDEIDEKAKKIGSVNTVYLKNGKTCGTNTDYDGFLESIKKYQVDVSHKDCYVLGTGGASLAIAAVLKDLGGRVYFVSRNPKENQIHYQELSNRKIDILINTTPVGMYPDIEGCPLAYDIIKTARVVIDIIFNPKQTKLLQFANSNMNGIYMLIMQAVRAEEIWQNQKIEIDCNEIEKIL